MSGMAKCTDVGADICAVQGAEAKCRGKGKCTAEWVEKSTEMWCGTHGSYTGAALTCSEDETITRVLCTLSQLSASVSSSTSSTAALDLYTLWLHSPRCWLPQLVKAGAGSCK